MTSLLYFPACREPDLDLPTFCEKCVTEKPRRDMVQCIDCDNEWCEACWWSPDYEYCFDCLLKRYHELARRVTRGEIEKAKGLARTV